MQPRKHMPQQRDEEGVSRMPPTNEEYWGCPKKVMPSRMTEFVEKFQARKRRDSPPRKRLPKLPVWGKNEARLRAWVWKKVLAKGSSITKAHETLMAGCKSALWRRDYRALYVLCSQVCEGAFPPQVTVDFLAVLRDVKPDEEEGG